MQQALPTKTPRSFPTRNRRKTPNLPRRILPRNRRKLQKKLPKASLRTITAAKHRRKTTKPKNAALFRASFPGKATAFLK